MVIDEFELNRLVRERREPKITFRQLVDMFGDDEDSRKLAQKQIRSLTIRRNKMIKPSHIIDKDLRFVVDELNKLEAEPLDKQIRFYQNFLATATADKNTPSGNVTEAQIEIARQYPIVELLESFGVEFKRDFAMCYLHGEKTASLHYIKDRNTCYCQGCHVHIDTISVVRHFKNLSFIEAVRSLV